MKESTKNIISAVGITAGVAAVAGAVTSGGSSDSARAAAIAGVLVLTASANRPMQKGIDHLLREDGKLLRFLRSNF